MPNRQFHTAISESRFLRYSAACEGNRRKAIQLYKANISLCKEMYTVIGVFEVILRNSIDRYFKLKKGDNWLVDAVQPGGFLDIAPGCENTFHNVQEAIFKLATNYTHDELIAKLTFGFWTYQFAIKEFSASGNILLEIFPNRPFGTKQKTVFKNLTKINDIRNRIAHHEPICFDKTTGNISINYTEKRYDLIKEMLYWLGCNPKNILFGIDRVQNATRKILETRSANLSMINISTQNQVSEK
jgi:hypothetical protein